MLEIIPHRTIRNYRLLLCEAAYGQSFITTYYCTLRHFFSLPQSEKDLLL